jgi:hypothetical protein
MLLVNPAERTTSSFTVANTAASSSRALGAVLAAVKVCIVRDTVGVNNWGIRVGGDLCTELRRVYNPRHTRSKGQQT